MKQFFLILAVVLLGIGNAVAQTSFDVAQPRNVVEGNRFTITFSLKNGSGNAAAPQGPELEGCQLLYGPATSTMQSYQVVNGHASSSTSTDYTFTYRADKAGSVTVPPVTINVGGKEYTSRQVSFSILPPDQTSQQGGNQQQGGASRPGRNGNGNSEFRVNPDDVLVRIILSRSRAYEEEGLECTIKLYTKYDIGSFMVKTQPSFDGFLIEELNIPSYLGEREHYNGSNYYTAVLKRCILFPQKSGKLTINSGQYELVVRRQVLINDWPFPRTVIEENNLQVNSNSATVDVLPLPQPQPDGFTGAVGKFSIDSRLVGSTFKTNEAATMLYTIKGTGNIKYISEPKIDFPSEFEVYSPRTETDARVSGTSLSGTMTVEYTFVPQSVGEFTIGSDKFVYFDPSSKEYVTLTTPTYILDVKQGANSSGSAASSSVNKQDIQSKNTDILHINLGDKAQSKSHPLMLESSLYWLTYLIAVILLAVAIYWSNKRTTAAADVTGRRMARANKVARRRLRQADAALNARKYDLFYEELLRAIWGYLSDKLSLPASQLQRDNIAAMLASYGAPDELIQQLIHVLDACEMARYTPQQSSQEAGSIMDQASETINRMENIKR